jgi:hypothetical protein
MAALVGMPKQLIASPILRVTGRPHLAADMNKMLE